MKLIINGKEDEMKRAEEVVWSGDIELAARSVNVRLMPGEAVSIGDIVELTEGKSKLFTGKIIYAERTQYDCAFEAVDNGIYLARNYISRQYYARPQEIARRVLNDLGLSAGSIAVRSGRENVISVGDMTAFAVLRKAYDGDGARSYVIRSENGKICIRKISTKDAPTLQKQIISAKKTDSIENMVNRVVILDRQTRRPRGYVQNASDRAKYGTFTRTYTEVSTKSSSTEAAKKLRSMEKTAKLSALDNTSCIAGEAVIVKRSEAGLNGVYVIGADKHIYTPEQRIMVLQLIR